MALVTGFGLSVAFGDQTIFSGADFSIGPKDKIGLIGVNGAGKTTLMRLLTKEIAPAEGTVAIGKDTVIGYMEQHACSGSERSMLDELLTVYQDVIDAEHELEDIARQIDRGTGDVAALTRRQQQLNDLLAWHDGFTYRSRARSALLGLGFKEEDFSLPCSVLSGGQRSKVSLAKLLLCGANLLLLDEPTNHLDVRSIDWLQGFLTDFRGSALIISHDRYFLDKVTNRTFSLEHGALYAAEGNYSRYAALRAERIKTEERAYAGTMKEIRRIEGIMEQQRQFNRERNYKTIASKQKAVDRLKETLVRPEAEEQSIRFSFKTDLVSGNDVLMCSDISKAFDGAPLFQDVSLHIRRGERVFLIGDNGCGKSTLLKILLGRLRRDSGKITLGVGVRIGYFDQTLAELSGSDKTVLDEVWDSFRKLNEVDVRRALAAFLFKGEDVFKSMHALSGGERGRVALLKLMLSGANFLILDEPTNHLDIQSREALEVAFDTFDGTMLVVSHDRYFINRLATRVLRLRPDGIDSVTGNYDDFCAAFPARPEEPPVKAAPKENSYKKQKELDSRIRRTRGKLGRLETEIDAIDAEIEALQTQLNAPETAANYEDILRLTTALETRTRDQEALMDEWQALGEELETLTAERGDNL
ncbi:MAG: ABC-F family ATP-binding cassette domain-containing protein [Clostridia bacterium]|nr:ABC-F family ATP-binding cassette domain-containing protein [Clostridia bacterium]